MEATRQALKLTLVLLFSIHVLAAAKENYAPLPDAVVKAKSVLLVNDGAPSKLFDAVYRDLKDWNHWRIVTDRASADLVLVISQRDSVEGFFTTGSAAAVGQSATGSAVGVPVKSSSWFLHVLDARNGEKLWSSDTSMGGKLWRTWNSIAKSLVTDIRKRLK